MSRRGRAGRWIRTRRPRSAPGSRVRRLDGRPLRRSSVELRRGRERAEVVFKSIGIIGGGAWGTALAQTVRLAGRNTLLWAREAEVVAGINGEHANTLFLPGVTLDAGLQATGTLADIAAQDVVLMVAPAQHVRAMGAALAPHL